MSIKKGTVVKVVLAEKSYHGFTAGEEVTATGEDFFADKNWKNFEDHKGYSQFLLPRHYEVISTPSEVVIAPLVVKVEGEIPETEVSLPSKVIYGVINSKDEVQATTSDRDHARDLKSILGGKRKGVRIFAYTASKEIR